MPPYARAGRTGGSGVSNRAYGCSHCAKPGPPQTVGKLMPNGQIPSAEPVDQHKAQGFVDGWYYQRASLEVLSFRDGCLTPPLSASCRPRKLGSPQQPRRADRPHPLQRDEPRPGARPTLATGEPLNSLSNHQRMLWVRLRLNTMGCTAAADSWPQFYRQRVDNSRHFDRIVLLLVIVGGVSQPWGLASARSRVPPPNSNRNDCRPRNLLPFPQRDRPRPPLAHPPERVARHSPRTGRARRTTRGIGPR